MRRSWWIFAVVVSASQICAKAQIATTPPMGWNSWDSYGLTISEDEFKQNVTWFNTHLKPYGWQYVVIDEGWYLAHPENASTKGADQGYTLDAYGRYTPALGRFASAASGAGLKPVADYVHSLGLKFGIHIIRGIPKQAVEGDLPIADSHFHAKDAAKLDDTCRWNPDNYGVKDNAAGQAYYDSLARLYASWELDFVKVDCISRPYQQGEIRMLSSALKRSGRLIVLSLSPGPTPLAEADDVAKQAQMWRISDDFWDVWDYPEKPGEDFPQSVTRQFKLLSQWEPYAGPGHWPDADMLPFGTLGPRPGWQQARKSRLTEDETRTVFTLWSIARSPLVLGANLTQMDATTEAILNNSEVIAVDQNSTGNQVVKQSAQNWVWKAQATSAKGQYIAIFNVGDAPSAIEYTWKELGLSPGKHLARDLWLHQDVGSSQSIKTELRPHACVIYRVE